MIEPWVGFYVFFQFDNSVRLAFSIPSYLLVDYGLWFPVSWLSRLLVPVIAVSRPPNLSRYSASHLPRPESTVTSLVGSFYLLWFLFLSFFCMSPMF